MSKLKEEDVKSLWEDIRKLMEFLEQVYQKELPYFYHFLEYMKHNIEIYYYTRDKNLEFLAHILIIHWHAVMKICAEPDLFNVQEQNRKEELELYEIFCQMSKKIETYFLL